MKPHMLTMSFIKIINAIEIPQDDPRRINRRTKISKILKLLLPTLLIRRTIYKGAKGSIPERRSTNDMNKLTTTLQNINMNILTLPSQNASAPIMQG